MARPKAIIDWDKVGRMLEAGCTTEGIAATIGISTDALYRRCEIDNKVGFSAFSQQKKSKGEDQLRIKQYDIAMKGNTTMLIWLGKQRLGQREQAREEHDLEPLKQLFDALNATKPKTD